MRPGIHVGEVSAVVAEIAAVFAFVGGHLCEIRAIQLHGKKLGLARILFVGREKHCAGGLVCAQDARDLVVALLQLPLQLGVRGKRILQIATIEINMHVAVAPTRPEELTFRFQEPDFHLVETDPGSGVDSVSTMRDFPDFASTKYKSILSSVRFNTSAHTMPSRSQPKRGM